MENGLLIYMMVMVDARERNEANRSISMGKRHTDCPTNTLSQLSPRMSPCNSISSASPTQL